MTKYGAKRVRFHSYEVDLETGELWKLGLPIKLAGQPFEILAYLVERPKQLVTREELRTQLWPQETFVDFDHGLNAAVNKLRLVLCDSAESPKYIETLPRRGYRFIGVIEETPNESVPTAWAAEEPVISFQSDGRLAIHPAGAADSEVSTSAAFDHRSQEIYGAFSKHTLWLLGAGTIMLALTGMWLFEGRVHVRTNSTKTAAEARSPILLSSLTSLSDRTSQPAFSPDGSRVAFVRDGFLPRNSGIWLKRVSGEELVQLTNNDGDCCPVWSPDGQSLIFSRVSGTHRKVYKIASIGGELHELFATDAVPLHGELDWSPDGRTIAYVAQGVEGTSAIFLRSIAHRSLDHHSFHDQALHQITHPSALERDWGPAFSPDGSRIVFVRKQDIMVISTEGKEVQRLFKTPGHIMGSPAWTPDGQSIVFAGSNGDRPNLMRIPASGGKAAQIREAGDLALSPAIARRGFRLACDELTVARSIDEIDFDVPGQRIRTLVTTGGENAAIQISHDGTGLVFQSDRAGDSDIWINDRDSQNPVRLTAIGAATAPRWSPDDSEIAFESGFKRGGRQGIFLMKASGGEPRPLIQDKFNNRAPRWSNDGKWIYFGSDRSGESQVWKVAAWGGVPAQVTHHGGFAAEESLDGKDLFYVKQDRGAQEIWRMAAEGGPESQVSPAIHPLDWAAWAIVKDGLLFVEAGADEDPSVSLYDFSSEHVKHITVLDEPPFWIAATRDGRAMLCDQPGQFESHVALLENFR